MNPTKEQTDVINAREKYILVRACPGSGKTATLVKRCQALYPMESKLVLAFNKKAADEFYDRVAGKATNCQVKTFHSFCLAQIRNSPQSFGYTRMPQLDSDTGLLKMMNESNGTDFAGWEDSPWDRDSISNYQHSTYNSELREIIQTRKPKIDWPELLQVKVEWLKKEGTQKERDDFKDDPVKAEIDWPEEILDLEDDLREYHSAIGLLKLRDWLMSNNILTFDEMIRVVAECREYLAVYVDHIMVDEFQDVDQFQFDIVSAIGKLGIKSMTCVGDPNQLIYRWRGALDDAFDTFQACFPECRIYPLTTNFRSLDSIISEAEKVRPVDMKGVRGDQANSVRTIGVNCEETDLYKDVHQIEYKELAVLCRYNRDVARWSLKLAKNSIPVHVIGKSDFWSSPHIRLAEAARIRKLDLNMLVATHDWLKLMKTKKYRRNEDAVKEALEDVKFVLDMSDDEYRILKRSLQTNDGIRISTIHKTKGMEFRRVLLAGVDEKLMADKNLYYVAITRAKDVLIFN